ncbi:MAG: hypothetical protein WBI17_09710 [Clostridiaceae bacterium]
MSFINGKIFYNKEYDIDLFEIEKYGNYYNKVREKIDIGYKPIIVSSDLMINILKKYFTEKKADIVKIELLEEDIEYQEHINKMIRTLKSNRDYFIDLIEEISFLSDNDNVEIRCLRFKYTREQELIDISVSLNGSLNYTNNQTTKKELDGLKGIISKYLKWLYKNDI